MFSLHAVVVVSVFYLHEHEHEQLKRAVTANFEIGYFEIGFVTELMPTSDNILLFDANRQLFSKMTSVDFKNNCFLHTNVSAHS